MTRADALENSQSILDAAVRLFSTVGVNVPVRDIAKEAGVGIATLYRHFPQRSDLIFAVVEKSINESIALSSKLSSRYEPYEALARWLMHLVEFFKAKPGLTTALNSGDDAYLSLPNHFVSKLAPPLKVLLKAAENVRAIRSNVNASELLLATARLAAPASRGDVAQARRMVRLLMDGLRFGAEPQA